MRTVRFLRLGLTLTGSSGGIELSEGIKAPARHPHTLEKPLTQLSLTELHVLARPGEGDYHEARLPESQLGQ